MSASGAAFNKQEDFWNAVIHPDNITVGELRPEEFDVERNLLFYRTPIQEYAYGLMGELEGRNVLELGCGLGLNSIIMARKGAQVTAIDIAEKRVQWVKELAAIHGLDNIRPLCMSAEEMGFEKGSFDIIYSNEVLIHTDRPKVLSLCAGLLRDGGRAVFIESLKYNPIISIYRNTLGPKIFKRIASHLKLKEIEGFRDYFPYVSHKEFYLFSPLAFFWQFGIRNAKLFRFSLGLLNGMDRIAYSCLPYLRNFSWMSCVECRK